jgi:hypothetical protein
MFKPFLILLLFLIVCPGIYASDNYPVGARSIGLSNAFVSISDPWSTFHNQASLASLNSFSAGVFYESRFMIDELSLAAASLIFPVESGTFGFSFYQFGKASYKSDKLGISYALQLAEKLNAALQLDYFWQQYPENESSFGFATFECGLIYKPGEHITLGAHTFNPIKNGFVFRQGKQKMSAIYRIGGHYQFSDMVLLSAEAQKDSSYDTLIKTGLEFSPVTNMALRFGVSGTPLKYTAGVGYSFADITCDIAFSYHGSLGFTPSFSIQYKLQ